MSNDPIRDLVNAALDADLPPGDDDCRPGLGPAYRLMYDSPVLVELATGEPQRPTMSTSIRIVNALDDAGMLRRVSR